ncbi:MAG TPA: right-handed parallel beta-helix repeat-containing protein, partial [Chlamydiales bacterium]|nr:right-handed parallel beta-helix repeat-containing protein [Chlamydiales bacterium]
DTERKGPARINRIEGNQIIVKRHLAASYTAINGEVGFPIRGFFQPINLYMALGPYYLFRKEVDQFNFGNAFGGEVRLNARILDGLDIGGNFSYDKLFTGRLNGYIMFSFPFGPATLRYGQKRWNERYPSQNCSDAAWRQKLLTQRVGRHEIIPIKTKTLTNAAVDPITGNMLSIVFVDNTMKWSGTGTYEAPFNSLALAELHSRPDQIIYLKDGHTYQESITLKPGQSLQGPGEPLLVEDTYYQPDIYSGPVLISPDGPAITLTKTGSVKGLSIETQNAWGIDATQSSSTIIQNVHFQGGTVGGVTLDGAPKGLKAIERCLFTDFQKQAIAINAQNLHHSEVRIRENHIHSMETGIVFSGPSVFHVRGNHLNDVGKSVIGSLSHGRSYSVIAYNKINGSATAISFQSDSNLAQIQIEHNTIQSKDTFNDALLLRSGTLQTAGTLEAYVSENTFQGSDAIFKLQNDQSHLTLRLENNWTNAHYVFINYAKDRNLFHVDALNKDESGVEDLNHAGTVLVPFEAIHFRPYEKGPRFFTPFQGFEEDRL